MANEKLITPFSNNPADFLTQQGIDKVKEENFKRKLRVCLPAIVKNFYGATADVQTAISIVSATGETINGPFLKNVPVKTIGGGGFAVYFPLQKGDTGWVMFADKDISIFRQSRKISPPNTYRQHDLADAVFIPDVMNTPQVAEDDKSKLVLQTLSGGIKLTLDSAGINIKGNTAIDGNLTVSGKIEASGDITSGGDIVAGTISLKQHIHGGVTSGSGTTGTPQ